MSGNHRLESERSDSYGTRRKKTNRNPDDRAQPVRDYVVVPGAPGGPVFRPVPAKSYEKPSVSYVRAGVCWGDKTSGVYDISGNNNIVVSKKFSIDKWKCLYNNQEYAFTNMPQEGAREILDLFLSSQKISVRHNKTISHFLSDGEKLLDKMTEMGITLEEIDAALLNEEF